MHEFYVDAHGVLQHNVDGEHRASVLPDGWDDYVLTWPQCAPIVESAKDAAQRAAKARQEMAAVEAQRAEADTQRRIEAAVAAALAARAGAPA